MREITQKKWLVEILLILGLMAEIACTSFYPSERFGNSSPPEKQNINLNVTRLQKIGELPTHDEYSATELQFISETNGWIFCNGNLWRTLDGGKSWESIYVDEKEDYAKFDFINSKNGWKHTLSSLLMTVDGGYTWTPINKLPIKTNKGIIDSISLFDNGNQGWVAGGLFEPVTPEQADKVMQQYYFGPDGTVLKRAIFFTKDNGKTWQKQNIESQIGSEFSLYVSRAGQVWAISNTNLFHLNQGRWEEIDFTKSNCINKYLKETAKSGDVLGDIYGIANIYFVDLLHGWISFENGYIAKTIDGGQNWCDLLDSQSLKEEPNEKVFIRKMYFADANKGWGLTTSGKLYETLDGGSTWSKINSNSVFSDMYFLDPQHGWVIAKEGVFLII